MIGAGMGLPGPIEQGDGVVGSSAILPGWIGMTAGDGDARAGSTSR